MAPAEVLPRDARLIALLIASCPSIVDAQPAVLHQLLEFAHRTLRSSAGGPNCAQDPRSLYEGYTAQVLSDALVYSEHAGRAGSLNTEDVKLAVQSRVGWEFGGKVPREARRTVWSPTWLEINSYLQFLLSLASKINAKPLPAVPEVFGVRLPPPKHCLTAVDFDLLPNKPPPGVKLAGASDEEDEEEDEEDEEGLYVNGDDSMTMAVDPMRGSDEQVEGDALFLEEDEDEEMPGGTQDPLPDLQSASVVGEKRKVDDEDDDYDA